MAKTGRPPTEGRTKGKRIAVRVTDEQKAALAAAAKEKRETLSVFLVRAGLERAGTVQPKGGG